jgi:BlaI family transcriptional regulator, penicillinase repressor
MDVLYEKGRATVTEVMEGLPNPPSYSAVRAALATLEAKGSVRHEKDGAKFVFIPKTSPETARRSAIRHLIQTFFRGSRESAVAALLEVSPEQFSQEELDRLAGLIEKARKGAKR